VWNILRGYESPEQAEAEACLHELRHVAMEWIKQSVVLESDCKSLILYIEKENQTRSSGTGLWQRSERCGACFQNVSLAMLIVKQTWLLIV
jgi:hypothetical protein